MTETAVVQPGDTYARLYQQITDRGPWMQTATGGAFFLADPQPSEVFIEDIASALSKQCRYNGNIKQSLDHYTVAQHGWFVSYWMEEDGHPPELCYAGLHHDSPETYTGDIVSQLKLLVPGFRAIEDRTEVAVFEALGVNITPAIKAIVKDYDMIALATEVRDVMSENRTEYTWGDLPEPRANMKIVPWAPALARRYFMDRHCELRRRMPS